MIRTQPVSAPTDAPTSLSSMETPSSGLIPPVQPSSVHQSTSRVPTDTRSSSDLPSISRTSSPLKSSRTPASDASNDDDDAEGSVDDEYASHDIPQPTASASRRSSQSSTQSLGKRKASSDLDEQIRLDPELYGLRRSGRARQARKIDSSDEDASDSDVVARPAARRRLANNTAKAVKPYSPAPSSDQASDESDEEDSYGSAKARAQTKKNRRIMMQQAASLPEPIPREFRVPGRRAAKITNYNEDDEDDFEEEDDGGVMLWEYTDQNAQQWPKIGVVCDYRLKADKTPTSSVPPQSDFEFLIKEESKAYIHAKWEDPTIMKQEWLGLKRLDNYYKNIVTAQWDVEYNSESADQREEMIIERQKHRDGLDEKMKVQRVVDMYNGSDGTEYYVKWKTLQYDECTWESGQLVSELAQDEIDAYLYRVSHIPKSDRKESNRLTRSPFTRIEKQPDYIKGGTLREFQMRGLEFIAANWCKGQSVVLADEMGLGKTIQTISITSWLRHDRHQEGPFIIVVPLTTLDTWYETYRLWAPDANVVVYWGTELTKEICREKELFINGDVTKTKFNILLTTYEMIQRPSEVWLDKVKWEFMAVDEAHRLKNSGSKLYDAMMAFKCDAKLLITGTPVQNNLAELSALMSFIMPGQVEFQADINLDSEEAKEKLAALSARVGQYMIRRTKKTVEKDLPPKTEKIMRVPLSDVQVEIYKNLLARNYHALNNGGSHKQSLSNLLIELKKCSNHPFLTANGEEQILKGSEDPEEVLKAIITSSGKMMLLDQLLKKLRGEGHRVLIFSQMVGMLNILARYLEFLGIKYQRIEGTIPGPERKKAIDQFNSPDSTDFVFLLSTRAGGLGINLATADTVVLYDSDWNPQNDNQAMSRAHRIGQKKPVSGFRFVTKDTVEEEVIERARNKLMLEYVTIQRGLEEKEAAKLKADLLARGIKTDLDTAKKGAEKETGEDIAFLLQKRSQKMFKQSGNQKRLEELDIDAAIADAEVHDTDGPDLSYNAGEEFLKNFEVTDVKVEKWEDIIPEDQRVRFEEERKRREAEEATQRLIEQNQPRKRKAPESDGREQRAAKKRARDAAIAQQSDDDDDDEEDDSDADPSRPLSESETRRLWKAFERYGYFEDCPEQIVKDAKLVNRNQDVLKSTLQTLYDRAAALVQQEQDRLANIEKNEGRAITKKDRKTVLMEFEGIKRINAETILERPKDMRMLRSAVEATSDFKAFRILAAVKAADYSCPWGAREDGMLCVGMARHGYGAWTQIRDDTELGLSDKFFLEEHQVARKTERQTAEEKGVKSPGAVHLVRRANYLFTCMRTQNDDADARKALENHHRNNKKSGLKHGDLTRISSSPAPGGVRKPRSGEKGVARTQHGPHLNRRRSDSHSKGERSSSNRPISNGERHGTPRSEDRHSAPRHIKRESSSHLHAPRPSTPLKSEAKAEVKAEKRSNPEVERALQPLVEPYRQKRRERHGMARPQKLELVSAWMKKLGQHVEKVTSGKGEKFAADCWDYAARNLWFNSAKHDGPKLQRVYQMVLDKGNKGEAVDLEGGGGKAGD